MPVRALCKSASCIIIVVCIYAPSAGACVSGLISVEGSSPLPHLFLIARAETSRRTLAHRLLFT